MIFVVSTTGQGDTPDSMKVYWDSILNIKNWRSSAVVVSCMVIYFTFPNSSFVLQAFWKFLLQRNLSQRWLEGVHYAVFGLGDSCYQKYNVLISFFILFGKLRYFISTNPVYI